MTEDGESPDSDYDSHRDPARTRRVYDEIATHFSTTRAYPWPEVTEFLDRVNTLPNRRVGLDIGCGNGRHTEPLADVVERTVGLDISRELLFEAQTAMESGDGSDWEAALVQADSAALPFVDGSVDVGVYVATLHHLPDRKRRVESLRELARVLSSTGEALVSAWSTEHDRFENRADDEGFDTTIDWTLPGGETVPRFYHIYAPEEFEADLRRSGLTVESSVVSSGNCYAVVSDGTNGKTLKSE